MKNKLKFIYETLSKLVPTKNPLEYGQWIYCNNIVFSWIIASIERDIVVSIFN
jgi:hypothetical protein